MHPNPNWFSWGPNPGQQNPAVPAARILVEVRLRNRVAVNYLFSARRSPRGGLRQESDRETFASPRRPDEAPVSPPTTPLRFRTGFKSVITLLLPPGPGVAVRCSPSPCAPDAYLQRGLEEGSEPRFLGAVPGVPASKPRGLCAATPSSNGTRWFRSRRNAGPLQPARSPWQTSAFPCAAAAPASENPGGASTSGIVC